eukprot:423378-Pyramimonas_sp.AAC.1
MVVSSSSTAHHPRHYLVDYSYGGISGCSGIARRSVRRYAGPQGTLQRAAPLLQRRSLTHILHPCGFTLVKSTRLLQYDISSKI